MNDSSISGVRFDRGCGVGAAWNEGLGFERTSAAGTAVAEAVAAFLAVAWTFRLVVEETAREFEVVKDRRGCVRALAALLAW